MEQNGAISPDHTSEMEGWKDRKAWKEIGFGLWLW